jgi:hypothetical protein
MIRVKALTISGSISATSFVSGRKGQATAESNKIAEALSKFRVTLRTDEVRFKRFKELADGLKRLGYIVVALHGRFRIDGRMRITAVFPGDRTSSRCSNASSLCGALGANSSPCGFGGKLTILSRCSVFDSNNA